MTCNATQEQKLTTPSNLSIQEVLYPNVKPADLSRITITLITTFDGLNPFNQKLKNKQTQLRLCPTSKF